jgi:nucleotide-binding universal stress UspA family protein
MSGDSGMKRAAGLSILAAVDGSRSGYLAVEEAGFLANRYEVGVIAVFVRQCHGMACSQGLGNSDVSSSEAEHALDVMEIIAFAQTLTSLNHLGVPWRFIATSGRPSTELMRIGASCDSSLIVVAGRQWTGLRRVVRSSVSGQLLARWERSLLVIDADMGGAGVDPNLERHGLWFNRQCFEQRVNG